MVRKSLFLIVITLLLSGTGVCADESDKTAAALAASRAWLAVVDAADYDHSWREAASMFKNAVQVAQWAQSMKAVREPLGRVISRKKLRADYHTSLPGAPDGAYVVIQYATEFENKKSAVETITPMLDKDSKWRVSGYYIK